MIYLVFSLIIMASLSLIRLLIGPTLWDRLLSLNLITSKLIMLLILMALLRGREYYLDTAVIYVLFSFFGTAFLAIFIHKKGKV